MTAINHALTGAIIGLTSGQPVVALPAALISHYLLDALPHFGAGMPEDQVIGGGRFRVYLAVEAGLCFLLVLLLFLRRPENWLLAAVCAFVAAAPDLLSFNRFMARQARRPYTPGRYSRFAKRIQWFERPIGAVVEAGWFIGAVVVLSVYI